ncbi:MAG: DUF5666 domain-containing protein [Minisyncoccia bacterium]
MTNKLKNKAWYIALGSVVLGCLLAGGTAFAAGPGWGMEIGQVQAPVVGTVSAVSGDTLTVTSRGFGRNATSTSYTVDASGATVTKAGTSSPISSIAIGDLVMIQGSVNGTNVTATTIRDGIPPGMPGRVHGPNPRAEQHASSTPLIMGNGEPVVGGNVSVINGSTLTVTTKAGVVYTVDATSATISKHGVTNATISNVSVGDSVIVQGVVNGTSVTASAVIDQGVPINTATSSPAHRFFGALGGFFSHVFGFF